MDVVLLVVEQEGRGACHTGERKWPFFRDFGSGATPGPRCATAAGPDRAELVALAREHRSCLWRDVLADIETPVSAFVKLVGKRPTILAAFLLESVQHAERSGRFSFLGWDGAHGGRTRSAGRVRRRSLDTVTNQGALGAIEALLDGTERRLSPRYPPFHGGVVGYLGYDVVRRDRAHTQRAAPTCWTCPTGSRPVQPASVVVFDYFRQRV